MVDVISEMGDMTSLPMLIIDPEPPPHPEDDCNAVLEVEMAVGKATMSSLDRREVSASSIELCVSKDVRVS